MSIFHKSPCRVKPNRWQRPASPTPSGLRRELAAAIFNLLLDAPNDIERAERELKVIALNDVEFQAAMRRFRRAGEAVIL